MENNGPRKLPPNLSNFVFFVKNWNKLFHPVSQNTSLVETSSLNGPWLTVMLVEDILRKLVDII